MGKPSSNQWCHQVHLGDLLLRRPHQTPVSKNGNHFRPFFSLYRREKKLALFNVSTYSVLFSDAVPTTIAPEQVPATKGPAEEFIDKSDRIVQKIGKEVGVPPWGMYAIVIGKLQFFLNITETKTPTPI